MMFAQEDTLTPVLSVHKLYQHFGRMVVLSDVNLDVDPGEWIALLWPDGAGKSTLIRILVGLLQPDQGDVRVTGVAPQAAALARRLSYIPSTSAKPTDETVQSYVERGASDLSQLGDVPAVLAAVGLDAPDTPLSELSRTDLRRAQIARAVVRHPDLLILDEPCQDLPGMEREELWSAIYRSVPPGTAVLIASSAIDDAEHCDRVGVMSHGRLSGITSPDRLLIALEMQANSAETPLPGRPPTYN
jgi:ABC-2 type transport system ATP-binding protein